ncbi:HHR211Wp [Eremothecium sinecaudum]|uniref:HHR211Wp n=1 Tax=Eremothecium sinecaudum TaxID=45286 RepID=A0A120K2Y3_9SACH|nr:HHR211Wp [Eremothecium sinecaudum]AMD22980.1 HHR211Wp [Eremothecium sinecaudum]
MPELLASGSDEPLMSNVKPLTNATLTIRVIKSFPYRNVKSFVLRDYNLRNKTAKDLFEDVTNHINTASGFKPFRSVKYDTIKIYTHAHGSKTVNLVINFDHDEDWCLKIEDEVKTLEKYGIKNETELSIYNRNEYEEFKANPEEKWL